MPDSPVSRVDPTRTALDIYEQMFATAADGMRRAGGFGEPERWRFDGQQTYTKEQWLDTISTTGGLTRLPPNDLAAVLASVGDAIDEIGGGFTMAHTTLAACATRGGG